MKKLPGLFLLLFLFSITSTFAQTSDSRKEMNQLLSKNLKYPTELRQTETEGLVVVSIAMDSRGIMTGDYEILSGDLAFEEEVSRTLNLLRENWDPSYLEGKTYGEEYLMSFDFKLSKGAGFPPNPFLTSFQKKAEVSPLDAVSQALAENPFSPKLYKNRAEILSNEGLNLRAEMDLNQAEFLENRMLTEVVIVGYLSQGPKSL
ncbi:hypothetical protein SAMN04489724_1882 [Algoriphagus locisalis]|uniref:TonB protein C-terminal n=1 Tax=Algoriphagus locisalis TaxID=305507 RepID=A0A1I7ADR1_9BACT|nr:energy transducer TonB [Algoriphagus locisalis]SFT73035.1 hypothetical protein SAMN04489724_1882 [Algoriphagus locisalis]